jgi:hypothetical protein
VGPSHGSSVFDTDFFSVVKSRLQAGHAAAARYRSGLHGLRTIITEEGMSGVYKGAGSKLLQSMLTAAILFASQRRIYELIKVGFPATVSRAICLLTLDKGDRASDSQVICFDCAA